MFSDIVNSVPSLDKIPMPNNSPNLSNVPLPGNVPLPNSKAPGNTSSGRRELPHERAGSPGMHQTRVPLPPAPPPELEPEHPPKRE